MASIREVTRQNGRAWEVRYRGSDRKQHSRTFPRKRDAVSFANSVESDIDRGSWIDPRRGKVTVGEWAESWLETKSDLRPSSRARVRGIMNAHLVPTFGANKLDEISNSDVRQWLSKMLLDGSSPATVRKAYNVLAQMLRAAVLDRRIVFNPCDDVPLPAEQHEEQKFLSPDEIDALADAMEPRFRALVLVAGYGGLRFGELAALRRGRVDTLRGRVTVAETIQDVHGEPLSFGPPKTKRSRRTVQLPKSIAQELERHLEQFVDDAPDALVFTGPKGGALRRAGFNRLWWEPTITALGFDGRREEAKNDLKPRRLRFHDLRHTFVTVMHDAGVSAAEISKQAGHHSVGFTLTVYGHVFERDDDDTLGADLDAAIGKRRSNGKITKLKAV